MTNTTGIKPNETDGQVESILMMILNENAYQAGLIDESVKNVINNRISTQNGK